MVERIQGMDGESPVCECGAGMVKKPTRPAMVTIRDGVTPRRSKGYIEGYSKEYLNSLGIDRDEHLEKAGKREKS